MTRNRLLAATFALLLALTACGLQSGRAKPSRTYQHLMFTSSVESEDCLLCGEELNHIIGSYLGQDNIGLVNLNTFDLLPIEINRYREGQLLEEATGVAQMRGGPLGDTRATAFIDVDRGYASIQIASADEKIDTTAASSFLCQGCLDSFAEEFFEDDNVSAVAVINFSTRELLPLIDNRPFFGIDNYLIDCDFTEYGGIDLLVTYRPLRYFE